MKILTIDLLTKEKVYNDTSIALGHTRWATHGNVNIENAHPIISENKVVVHNGIIENYLELKEKLLSEKFNLKAKIDTEVIPNLFIKYIRDGNNFLSQVD